MGESEASMNENVNGLSAKDLSMVIMSFVIIIINSIEMVMLIRLKKKLSSYQLYLLSLAIADLLVGLSVCCLKLLKVTGIAKIGLDDGDGSVVLWYSICSSLAHIWAITVDRLFAVCRPIKHKLLVTPRRTMYIIVVIWLIGVPIFPIVFAANMKIVQTVIGYVTQDIGLVILISYSVILYKSISNRRKTLSGRDGASLQQKQVVRKELHLALLCFTIAVSYLALTFPFSVTAVTHADVNSPMKFALILNSLTNPLIYFFWKYMERRMKTTKVSTSAGSSSDQKRVHDTAL